jgi:hypothetical protein
MSKVNKPKTVNITVTLRKDLHNNEEICPTCKGVGLVIADNPYGLENSLNNNHIPVFPYKHQALRFCPTCYNGVIRRCKYCGEIIPNLYTKCNCEKQQEVDFIERQKKMAEKLANAPEATSEILKKSDYFYSDSYSYNDGYFSDWEDFFEDWYANHEVDDPRPEYVWATEPYEMSIDAYNLIENATEDLYEDAIHDISDEKLDELQELLNNWCKNSGVQTTYYQSKYKVKIPWEEY